VIVRASDITTPSQRDWFAGRDHEGASSHSIERT